MKRDCDDIECDEEALMTVLEDHYNRTYSDPLVCMDVIERNPLNHTLIGTIEWKGAEIEFEIDDGNMNGTVIRRWEAVGGAPPVDDEHHIVDAAEEVMRYCRCGQGVGERHIEWRQKEARKKRANRLFKGMWHSTADMVRKDGQDLCFICEAPAIRTILYNIWGTVYTLRVCDDCKVVHGMCAEVWPTKDTVAWRRKELAKKERQISINRWRRAFLMKHENKQSGE